MGEERISAAILALATNPWRGPWMNRQQLLSRLGQHYAVLYSTGPFSTYDIGKTAWTQASWVGGYERSDNIVLDQPPASLLRVKNRAWTDRLVLPVVAARWRRRLRRERPGPRIAYVFHPKLWTYAAAFKPDVVVYHAYDVFRLQVGWNDEAARDERGLINRADIVIGSSTAICEELRQQGATTPVLVTNAADFAAYSSGLNDPEPSDLSTIAHPRLGYIGKISRKVDLGLIGLLAEAHPAWQFVFVGDPDSPDAESRAGVARLRQRSNVHFLGFKHHTQLPAYAARMDVNLICHRLGQGLWTEGTFPLKLYEYLAAGLPVISSDIPSVRAHSDVVTIASTTAEWEQHLTTAIEAPPSPTGIAARQAVAAANTWEDRVHAIDTLMQDVLRAQARSVG